MNEEVSNLEHLKIKCDEIRTLLKQHRQDARLTQDDTAKWIGVTRKQMIEFENGTRFDIELICRLGDKLGIEIRLNYTIN